MTIAATPTPTTRPGPVAQPIRKSHESDCENDHDEPGKHHCSRKVGAGERFVRQHDEIGQVRAGQEQRGTVRHEERPIQERALVTVAPSCCVKDDGRQEDHSRVEVEHRGHDCLEPKQCGQERKGPSGKSLDARTQSGEQTVGLDHGADHEQAGHQYKRRPGLPGSLTDRGSHVHDRT